MNSRPRHYYFNTISVAQSGLAITPSDIHSMASQGIPATASNLNSEIFNDGTLSNSMDIDPIYKRGVTACDLWESSKHAKSRLRSAYAQQSSE